MVNELKKRVLSIFTVLIISLSIIMGVAFGNADFLNTFATAGSDNKDFVYLSDLDYDGTQSSVGWSEILKDKTVNDTKITVKIEGAWYSFDKGIFTHAPATVVYDISGYNYNYFTAYTGLDKLITKKSDGVKFLVYTSADGTNWTLKTSETPNVLGIAQEAEFLTADISGADYLKLVVDPNANSGADYAVWADAKLTNSIYGDETVKPLSYFDEQIKAKGSSDLENDKDLELLVLQREFVRKVGQYALKRFKSENANNQLVLDWLINDVDNLREFMLGGDPVQGSYYNALKVLSDLYRNYKNDLNNRTLLNNKWAPTRTYGDMYRTMMFSVALTHDGVVGSWLQKSRVENQSDPVRRYAIYRYLHNTGRFIATKDENGNPIYETQSMFESLTVEEMRWIMYDIIDDESIIWLNDYVQTKINAAPQSAGGLHTPHPYIAYTTPNYNNPVFYAEENREYFNELFAVDDREHPGQKIGMWDTSYTIPGGVDSATYTLQVTRGTESDKLQKVWMNFRNKFNTGSVCGGISKSGTNIRGVRGVPVTVIGQPGHAAMLCYGKNSEGKGYWGIDNDVSGWTLSTKGERHLLGWGNADWQRTHPTVVYFHIAQDALNDYDSYVLAEEYVMLARVYEGNTSKQEELYEKALSIQKINLDAWHGLIETYKASGKTEQDYVKLIKRISDTLVGYPLPMFNTLNLIKPMFTTTSSVYQYNLLEKKALTASSTLPNTATDKTMFPNVARGEALYLLGNVNNSIATFSFDGENAGCIVWSSAFDQSGIHWKYSIDGKNSWKDVVFTSDEPHIHKLSQAELSQITEENDIYIHIYGIDETEENYYKIDISSKPSMPNTLYGNDYENLILGLDERFEWRYIDTTEWTAYTDAVPDCKGNKSVEVRIKAAGGFPPSDIETFEFTENTDSKTMQYVSVSHLTVEGYSSQSKDSKRPNYAINAIDGNINTYWHTDYAENILTSGNTPYLIIKSDTPRYFSGLELAQYQYNSNINIFAKNIKVSVSKDAKHWTEVAVLEDLEAMDDLKTIHFEESVLGQYIKVELDTYGIFTTLSMVNVYEDATKIIPHGGTNKTAAIVVPIVVCLAVAAAAGVAFVMIRRKKALAFATNNNAEQINSAPDKKEQIKATSKKSETGNTKQNKEVSNKAEPKKAAPNKPAEKTTPSKAASSKPAEKATPSKAASSKPAEKTTPSKAASNKPAEKATPSKASSNKPANKTASSKVAPKTTKKK